MNLIIANTAIRTDADNRYCLNDLHKAAGEEKRHGASYWLANQQTKELVAELGDTGIPVSVVRGGPGLRRTGDDGHSVRRILEPCGGAADQPPF